MATSNYKTQVKAFYLADGAAVASKVGIDFDAAKPAINVWNNPRGGSGMVTITPLGSDEVLIESQASYHTSRAEVSLRVERVKPVLTGVLSALTTRGPVATNGGMFIDGRDHDLNGIVLANAGSLGVYSESTYSQDAISAVGGTNLIDYAPSTPGNSLIIAENGSDAKATPDGVLDLPAGTLKAMALSGAAGSQYVTNPADLTWPLKGVTYIEIPPADPWWIVAGDKIFDGGTGVVVIHNKQTNAIIKNLNKGTFRGLIIADDIVHIHNTIIGAVVSLTPFPSEGNVIGNGKGQILYSSEALNSVTFLETVKEIAWKEKM